MLDQLTTIPKYARSRGVLPWKARLLFDRLFPTGGRHGLYRVLTPQHVEALDAELAKAGKAPSAPEVKAG